MVKPIFTLNWRTSYCNVRRRVSPSRLSTGTMNDFLVTLIHLFQLHFLLPNSASSFTTIQPGHQTLLRSVRCGQWPYLQNNYQLTMVLKETRKISMKYCWQGGFEVDTIATILTHWLTVNSLCDRKVFSPCLEFILALARLLFPCHPVASIRELFVIKLHIISTLMAIHAFSHHFVKYDQPHLVFPHHSSYTIQQKWHSICEIKMKMDQH